MAMREEPAATPVYSRILDVIRLVPYGHVATYGQIALIVGDCTPRMVGYCLASLEFDSNVPWQRIINHKGMVSPRSSGHGSQLQRELLIEEGVEFDGSGRINFRRFGWIEPDPGLSTGSRQAIRRDDVTETSGDSV